MLEVYEGRRPDRKLVREIPGETLEIVAVSGYLIWLKLIAENKLILEVLLSPHQLGRLGKYLADSTWRGGIICPDKSQPEDCYITELDDQAKYLHVIGEIKRNKASLQELESWTDKQLANLNAGFYRKQISDLELEALMLKGSTRFGLVFNFWLTKPEIEVEWLPEDREAEAKEFLRVTKLAYGLRQPEPVRETDLTEWKRKLFEV